MFLFAGAEAAESRRGGSTMRRSTLYPAARSGGRWAYSEEPLAEIDFSPTHMADAGYRELEIARQLRHKDAGVTRAVYIHELHDAERRAMQRGRLDGLVGSHLEASANNGTAISGSQTDDETAY